MTRKTPKKPGSFAAGFDKRPQPTAPARFIKRTRECLEFVREDGVSLRFNEMWSSSMSVAGRTPIGA
jgi:hypothetical protein